MRKESVQITNKLGLLNTYPGIFLPISAMPADGTFPTATAMYEKRNIAIETPVWDEALCIQCGICSFVCPHATIRMKIYDEKELANAPDTFKSCAARGKEMDGKKFSLQVAVEDCTGCGACVYNCPAKSKEDENHKAINMRPQPPLRETERANFDFFLNLPETDPALFNSATVKGSQLLPPLFEFSGACAGCGETPYLKVITQLYGDRMLIANATGCSSIWGGSAPSVPFSLNHEGHGPAWANSLFEDNAEYGFGMALASFQRREKLKDLIQHTIDQNLIPPVQKETFQNWITNMFDADESKQYGDQIKQYLKNNHDTPILKEIWDARDMFTKKSVWSVGGDGWAYDIGYGGLDHVLAMNEDINILVFDTEVYSNTGGQSSKATPIGSIAKFAESGKKTKKKDLGLMAMSYGYVYVASVAMGANKNQMMKAFKEAESYPGPSLIICYAPCINQGIKAGMGKTQEEEKRAVESGYWPLYRYDPRRAEQGENPFQLDYKEPDGTIEDFIMGEVRYAALYKTFPKEAEKLHKKLKEDVEVRYKMYKSMSEK